MEHALPSFYRTVDPVDNLCVTVTVTKTVASGRPRDRDGGDAAAGGALGPLTQRSDAGVSTVDAAAAASLYSGDATRRTTERLRDTYTATFKWQEKVFSPRCVLWVLCLFGGRVVAAAVELASMAMTMGVSSVLLPALATAGVRGDQSWVAGVIPRLNAPCSSAGCGCADALGVAVVAGSCCGTHM